jgi:hypothetical protein
LNWLKILWLLKFAYWWITKTDYDKKLEELKDKQTRLGIELEEYTQADYNYKTTVSTILNISRRARDIFDSSETYEKRALLGFLLQNPVVEDKKLLFTMKKPWDVVFELATTPRWLEDRDLRPRFAREGAHKTRLSRVSPNVSLKHL